MSIEGLRMYDYLKGIPVDKKKSDKGHYITVEVAGIGYLIEAPERDFISIDTTQDKSQKFFVSLIHREDSMTIF